MLSSSRFALSALVFLLADPVSPSLARVTDLSTTRGSTESLAPTCIPDLTNLSPRDGRFASCATCDGDPPCRADYGDLEPGPVAEPCVENRWGTPEQARSIEDAMYTGSKAETRAAIDAARRTRGTEVGCAEIVFGRSSPDPTPPSIELVESAWHDTFLLVLGSYEANRCPAIGREWPAAALAGILAQRAGLEAGDERIAQIVDDVVGAQYVAAHAPEPLVTYEGLYGYAETLADPTSPCGRGGVVGRTISHLCALGPSVCPTYGGGPFSGTRFVVVDFLTEPRAYDGGAAYDHGWSAAAVLEASLAAPSFAHGSRWHESLLAAAGWSLEEPAVRNHNYTAKNVWVLALAYQRTGDRAYRDALMDKVRRNLLPAILVDRDCDGEVDGLDGVRFAGLVASARIPGRMWDAHNALPWYHSMNAWALAEAYVALRERGDVLLASEVRPYALAMLDNLARELLELGPPRAGSAQHEPIAYALAVGLWKIAGRERGAGAVKHGHEEWVRAFATLWNAGYFEEPGWRRGAALMTYLLFRRGIPFEASVPSGERASDAAPASERHSPGPLDPLQAP